MRTLNKKVLPIVRVLLAKCNKSEDGHQIQNGIHRLGMIEQKNKSNASFRFYRIYDGISMFDIAVSKLDADKIIPVTIFIDRDYGWMVFCSCASSGEVIFKDQSDQKAHDVFCIFIQKFFQYANIYHKIV